MRERVCERATRVPSRAVVALATLWAVVVAAGPAAPAEPGVCRIVETAFTPTDDLQIVIWVEDPAGNFLDTIFITDLTGRRGLGNRPGRMDFNSAWRWPYGRRETTFPVWAHRHGLTFPRLYFQNDNGSHEVESALSHPPTESSIESFYCRPLRETDANWDTQTCASVIYTDKGVMSATEDSLYPPRADIAYDDGIDDPSVQAFDDVNPFDAVTQATPIGGRRFRMSWSVPDDLPDGDYVLWIEVSKELDFNATYNPTTYPEPTGFAFSAYGEPYRGQPSVVYRAPFQVGPELTATTTSAYAGYGDPDGMDGVLRAPDDTIDDDVPGSGALRLLTTVGPDGTYRLRVEARVELDDIAPATPVAGETVAVTSTTATVSFYEPGDDDLVGAAYGYEIRYRAGEPITEANFVSSSTSPAVVVPEGAGALQAVTVGNLLPQTRYWIGIRAYDDCNNYSPLMVMEVTTADRASGEVDACFVATAAYGSLLANDVAMLRDARDGLLRSNALGELLVEAYYTFGPALAGVIGESEELRGLARDLLDPAVAWMRDVTAFRGED
jgi:hypothetical protein